MASREEVIAMVKQFLAENNIPEETAKLPNEDCWALTIGSLYFEIRIRVFQQRGEEKEGIVIAGIIMEFPQDQQKQISLIKELMNINAQIVGAWFATHNNQVILVTSREIQGLDYTELLTMIQDVGLIGDYYDDILKSNYGG